jgi:phosphate transport system permease protein
MRESLSERSGLQSIIWPSLCAVATLFAVAACVAVFGFVVREGAAAISSQFLTTDPVPTLVEAEAGGIRTPLVGTLVLIGLSIVLATPLSLAAAIYLAEYMDETRWTTRSVRVGLEVLASVPSVVFGMFGIALFSASFFTFLSSSGAQGAEAAFGRSFLVASIVMAVHILPFMTKVMEEAIRAVPSALRQAAAGLGIGKWRSIRLIVLPRARSGLSVAVILGMGLVAGDTAIVWLLLGGSLTMGADSWWRPDQWLDVARGTGSTLTTYTYFASPAGEGMAPGLAFGAALVLMAIVLVLNVVATLVARAPGNQRL